MMSIQRRFVLLLAVFASVAVSAARPSSVFSRVEAELLLVSPPEVEFKSSGMVFTKIEPDNRWLMIRVNFTVPRVKNTPPEYREKGGRRQVVYHGFLDDVDLEVRVLFDTGFKVNGQAVCGMFTGRTRFAHIKCDGRRHQAFMFVPARILDRYFQMSDGSVRRAAKSDFKAEAVFSSAGRELGRAYCNVSGRDARDAFEKALNTVPENLQIAGGVLPRSRTPWALLNYDSFDQEKEAAASGRD